MMDKHGLELGVYAGCDKRVLRARAHRWARAAYEPLVPPYASYRRNPHNQKNCYSRNDR